MLEIIICTKSKLLDLSIFAAKFVEIVGIVDVRWKYDTIPRQISTTILYIKYADTYYSQRIFITDKLGMRSFPYPRHHPNHITIGEK